MLAYSTVFGQNLSDEADFDFIKGEGDVLKEVVAPWFGTLFWVFGTLSLALVALGVVDYVSRLVADVTKTLYARDNERWSESKIYFLVVWSMVAFGTAVLLAGFDQPLVLLVLSACLNGIVMFIYSILLIRLNRKSLPKAIRVTGVRLGCPVPRGRLLRLLRGLARHRPDRRPLEPDGAQDLRPLRGLPGHVRRALRGRGGARSVVRVAAARGGRVGDPGRRPHGAADTAVGFAAAGLPTAVLPWRGAVPAAPPDAAVLAFDTASRDLDAGTAADRAGRVAHWFAGHCDERAWLYKKLDSTLRGNAAAELSAVERALCAAGRRPSEVVIAPAFPALGRTTVDGRQRWDGEAVDVARLLGDPEDAQVERVVVDARRTEDLEALADALEARPGRPLLVGSGGLAAAHACRRQRRRGRRAARGRRGRCWWCPAAGRRWPPGRRTS